MRTEVKVALAAIGLFGLVVVVVYFWNQPKGGKTNLPVSNTTAANAPKPGADRLTSPPGSRPPSSIVTAMKPGAATPPAGSGATPASGTPGSSTSGSGASARPDVITAGNKTDAPLPPIANPPPTRKTIEAPIEPAAGSGSAAASGTPAPPSVTSSDPVSAIDGATPAAVDKPVIPSNGGAAGATTGSPSGGNSSTGAHAAPGNDGHAAGASGDRARETGAGNRGEPARSRIVDSEIERAGDPPLGVNGNGSGARSTGRIPTSDLTPPPSRRESGTPREAGASGVDTGNGKPRTYTIQKGDSLVGIAREQLGDENLWRQIKLANPGLNENRIFAGTSIKLPERSATVPPSRTAGASAIKPGAESVTNLPKTDVGATKPEALVKPATGNGSSARPATGNGATARRDERSEARPPATDAPKPGTEKPDTAKPEAEKAGGTHTVARGETLRKIAKLRLKSENRWREIYDLNRKLLSSPDGLEIGMTLKLPAEERSPRREPARRSGR